MQEGAVLGGRALARRAQHLVEHVAAAAARIVLGKVALFLVQPRLHAKCADAMAQQRARAVAHRLVARRPVELQQKERAEQVARKDRLVCRDGHKAARGSGRIARVGGQVELRGVVVVHGIAQALAHVHTVLGDVDIGDVFCRDPAQQPPEQAVLLTGVVVHHVKSAGAGTALGVGVQVGQAEHVAGLVDHRLTETLRGLAAAGARGEQDGSMGALAVEGRPLVARPLADGELLGPPCGEPLAARTGKLQVDGIDVAVVVGIAPREINLVVHAGEHLLEELLGLLDAVSLVIGARVLRRVAHHGGHLVVELSERGALVVGMHTLVGVAGTRRVGGAVKGGEQLGVRLVGRDGHGLFAAVGARRKAHANHHGARLARGGKAQSLALGKERAGRIGELRGQRDARRLVCQPFLRLRDQGRGDALLAPAHGIRSLSLRRSRDKGQHRRQRRGPPVRTYPPHRIHRQPLSTSAKGYRSGRRGAAGGLPSGCSCAGSADRRPRT